MKMRRVFIDFNLNLRIYESTNLRIYESTNLRIYESAGLLGRGRLFVYSPL
jgi:hypothetical protein